MPNPKTEPEVAPVWCYEGYRLEPSNLVAALAHYYRAEVTRTNVWRTRLDTTTNWAVVTTAAALTFAFSANENPHFVLLLVQFLVLVFLLIEARRYSYYGLWYHRVRLLETDFFAAMIAPPFEPAEGWGETLAHTMREPTFLIPRWRAVAIRYRRNYIWLFSIVILAWLLKLSIHPTQAPTLAHLVERAAVEPWVSGGWVLAVVGFVYVGLLGLVIAQRLIPAPSDARPQSYQEPPAVRAVAPQQEQLALIVTNRKTQIAERLMSELRRGVTALNGTGMYTGEPRDLLLCALTRTQESEMRAIVEEIDPDAFVILIGARDIRGKGFAPAEPPS